MSAKKAILFLFTLVVFTSCKTYEVMHYKGAEIDKVTDLSKYKVYVHAQKNTFLVTKPTKSQAGISGDITPVKDHAEEEEIRNPGTPGLIKKHRHDLNLFTKTAIADSTVTVTIKKTDISEYSLTLTHSKVHWDKIGEVIAGVFGVAICLGIMGVLVYWFTLT